MYQSHRPDLARVVETWATVPEPSRRAVVALVAVCLETRHVIYPPARQPPPDPGLVSGNPRAAGGGRGSARLSVRPNWDETRVGPLAGTRRWPGPRRPWPASLVSP